MLNKLINKLILVTLKILCKLVFFFFFFFGGVGVGGGGEGE
jgi:hypothetical protein